jgi:hypothetical protein
MGFEINWQHAMKITTRRKRTARKLVLPLIAISMMCTAMYLGSGTAPPQQTSRSYAPGAAARVPHDLHQR